MCVDCLFVRLILCVLLPCLFVGGCLFGCVVLCVVCLYACFFVDCVCECVVLFVCVLLVV